MPTYRIEEFFSLARKKDSISGQHVNPDLYRASMELEKYPRFGSGSRGGGYIYVCEWCGQAGHTYNSNKKFCDVECKTNWLAKNRKPYYYISRNKIKGSVRRRCETCGNVFGIRHSILPKGRGIFCCPECYQKLKLLKPQWFVCNNCGTPFKALTYENSKFCCMECDKHAPKYDESGIYITYAPVLLEENKETLYNTEFNIEAIRSYKKFLKEIENKAKITKNRGVSSGNVGFDHFSGLPKLPIDLLLPIRDRLDLKYSK